MNTDLAQEILTYNTWANQRFMDIVSRLDTSLFTRTVGGSYPSIQSTLTHMVWVEWVWLERWQGHSPKELWTPEEFPSAARIASRFSDIQANQRVFAQSLTADQLQRVIRYTNRKGETWEYALWRMIYHLVNHSSYHRGQVTNMLRILNVQPVPTDFLDWWDEGR